MGNKALRILEYDKIKAVLADFTTNPAVADRIQALEPTPDLQTAESWQKAGRAASVGVGIKA